MRTLKFRAWQTVTKTMFTSIEKGTGDSYNPNPPFADYLENKNMIVMQFTGLKDKNEQSGYEGDIVKMFDRSLFVVVWDEYYARFQLELVNGHELSRVHDMGMLQYGEIIGNIYEHHELMKEGEQDGK